MKSPTTAQERPKFSYLRERAFVGGRWVEAGTRACMAVHNPATGTHLGDVPDCGEQETAEAIEAAKAAFPAWKARTAKERAAVLRRLSDCIEKGSDQLAALLTAEQGKSLTEARGEIASSAAYVRFAEKPNVSTETLFRHRGTVVVSSLRGSLWAWLEPLRRGIFRHR